MAQGINGASFYFQKGNILSVAVGVGVLQT